MKDSNTNTITLRTSSRTLGNAFPALVLRGACETRTAQNVNVSDVRMTMWGLEQAEPGD